MQGPCSPAGAWTNSTVWTPRTREEARRRPPGRALCCGMVRPLYDIPLPDEVVTPEALAEVFRRRAALIASLAPDRADALQRAAWILDRLDCEDALDAITRHEIAREPNVVWRDQMEACAAAIRTVAARPSGHLCEVCGAPAIVGASDLDPARGRIWRCEAHADRAIE